MANRPFSSKDPIITQGKYGEVQDFGGGAMVFADPRDNPDYKAPATSTGTPPAKKEDPIGSSTVRRYTGKETLGESAYDKASREYVAQLDTTQPDESMIRSKALEAVEAQKNAIINTYAGLVAEERKTGVGRLGRTRATAARSGTLGSDFGNADLAETDKLNADQVAALEREKQLKIEELFNGVNKDVADRVQKQKDLAKANMETRLAYFKETADKAKSQVKALAQAGATIDDLTDVEFNHLLETTGMTEEQLKTEFTINKPKKDIVHQEVMGNKYLVVSKDPKTGALKSETVDLGFSVPQGYKVQKLDNGQILFMPDKIDPSRPFSEQVMTYGSPTGNNPTENTKPITDGALKTTQGDIAKGVQFLNSGGVDQESGREFNGVGTDGWADPNLYKYLYDQWRANGGTPSGFIKYYPPKDYVNPAANPQLPSFLQNKSSGSSGSTGA